MQCTGVEGDVFHAAAVDVAWDFVGALEITLECQLASAGDQNGMNIGIAGREAIGHPAQRFAIDELVVIGGGDRPAIVACDGIAATAGLVRGHRQRAKRCQRSSSEK